MMKPRVESENGSEWLRSVEYSVTRRESKREYHEDYLCIY